MKSGAKCTCFGWRGLACLLAVMALPVGAQTIEPPASGSAAHGTEVVPPAHKTAPVVIDGVTLFNLRGVSAFPPERRAVEIAVRIENLAGDKAVPLSAIQAVDLGNRTGIAAGKHEIMFVFDVDAETEGVPRPILAEVYRRRIAEVVESYRADRTPRALLIATAYVLGAAALLAAFLFLLQRTFGLLHALIDRRLKTRLKDLRIQSFRFVQAEHLWAGVEGILRVTQVVLVILAVVLFIDYTLGRFPWTRSLQEQLLMLVIDPLAAIGRGFVDAIPGLLFIAVLVVVTRYFLKTIRLFFGAVARGAVKLENFDEEWAWPTYRIVRLLVIAFALVIAYPYIPGSDSDAFKGVSLFLGVIFSLGSTSVIANIIAGYSMTYRRAFRVGDRVKVGAHVGDVEEVRLLVTGIRTLKGERVVIPNSMILNSDIVNYSNLAGAQGLLLHTTVGIGYETPWRQVEAMLRMAAGRTEGVLREPPPFVLQQGLGDFCITYELNVYCDQPKQMPLLYTALHQNILDVFNEHGVQIMTPAYVADSPQAKVVPKDQWHLPPATKP